MWRRENIPEMLSRKPEYQSRIKAVGIGFGGPLESETGRVLSSIQVPGWEDFKLREWFAQTTGLPAYVLNDTVAGGYAELLLGAGKETQNFFYTNIGTGIGGALFINRRFYDGIGFGASYLGNTYIPDWTGKEPGTAIKLENICSGMHTETRLRRPGYVPGDSLLMELCGGNPQKLTHRMLEQAVRAGDAFACAELDGIARSFAIGLCNFMAISPAELIAVGGGVSKMGDILFDRVRNFTAQYAFIANQGRYKIVQSELLDNAVIAGAVLCAANRHKARNE